MSIGPQTADKTVADAGLVAVIAYDGLSLFEYGCAVEIFGLPRPEMGGRWYRFATVADSRIVSSGSGRVQVSADGDLSLLSEARTIIVPGWRGVNEPVPDRLCTALREAHARGTRVISICTGAFVLAASGLLDGKRATTHWRHAAELSARYPKINVDPDVLYVDEGSILTSAGSSAGIDVCLHLIRRDLGAAAANLVARRLVMPPHREGGQAQYIERSSKDRNSRLGLLTETVRMALHEDWSVKRLANVASMSTRSFQRHFAAEFGITIGEWLLLERIGRARELLESTSMSPDEIATEVGLGTATLRDHFRRRLNTTLGHYRDSFRGAVTDR